MHCNNPSYFGLGHVIVDALKEEDLFVEEWIIQLETTLALII